ncbi:MAG: hypothetical protein HZA91_06595 [Verrucomicrobia bacterium]|nr:hypothetical protein [Verrucomicrobiota bacterium]
MRTHRICWRRVRGVLCGLASLLLMGCETPTKHELLTFFFDGVDKPIPQVPTPTPDEIRRPASQPSTDALAAELALKEPAAIIHAPYEVRQCDACHESKFSQKLRADLRDVCLTCHQNVLEKAKFKHAPAESGDCLICHHPHQSKEKSLLTRAGQSVCLECHEKGELIKAPGHKTMGESACQQCHDPHKGDDKYFLKKQLPGKAAPSSAAAR